jgi:ferritin-like metal-binding protein YciE
MPINDPKALFLLLLSNVRHGAVQGKKIYQEISQLAQDPDVKESLEARALISEQAVAKLDRCFEIIGQKPVQVTGRLQEIFMEDFRKELNEIQSPVARRLYVLAKANHLTHLRIGEYVALTAAADISGHFGVGVLLESCLADKLAFVERNRRLLRSIVEAKVQERIAA